MALNLSTLTSPATSGDVLAEALTTADFLEGVPVLRNLARGSQKGGDAKQDVALNQPKALPLIDGDGYLYVPDVASNTCSTPDDSSIDITGDITIDIDLTLKNWNDGTERNLVSKYRTSDGQRSYRLFLTATNRLSFVISSSGAFESGGSKSPVATVSFPDNQRAQIRVQWRSSDGRVQFFTSTDKGQTFTQLGTDLFTSGITSIYNGTADLDIAHRTNVNRVTNSAIHSVQIYDSVTPSSSSLRFNCDFTATNVRHGDTKFKCATGQVVTINKSGNDPATIIKKPVLRFSDAATTGLRGLFNQTITEGYMFAAFSVLGNGGETSARVFSINSTGNEDYQVNGSVLSAFRGTNLSRYVAAWDTLHAGMSDDANGDILHEIKIESNAQVSRVNNADEATRTTDISAISAEEFNIGDGSTSSTTTNAAIDLEFLALFSADAVPDEATASKIRNYINNRNNVFDLKDGFGYYFYDAQNAPVGNISSGSASWNGRIIGSDFGDTDKLATQGTSDDQPVGDGYVVNFADNSDFLTIPSTTQAGWQVVGTSLGTFAYRVQGAVTELNLLGNAGVIRTAGDSYGMILLPESATGADIEAARKLLIDRGAADGTTSSAASNDWYGRSDIVEFKHINTSSLTALVSSFRDCINLENFPALDLSNSNNFTSAWNGCSALQSFPAGAKLGTAANNVDFSSAWRDNGLTSFSTPLPTATTLSSAFRYCSSLSNFNLAEIPLVTHINTAFQSNSITSFNTKLPKVKYAYATWYGCTALTDFSADVFANWNPSSISTGVFNQTWKYCTLLTAQSVENILTSIDTSGQFATTTGASGGPALGDSGIDIDYNSDPLSAATNAAIDSLSGKGWQVFINGVLVIPNILDLQPAAAYSLRSFDADADPNVVNVRRSSDGATSDFTASEVSDGTLVAFVGAGFDGHVTTWYDQSIGGTSHATQTVASSQPKLVDAGTLVTEGGLAALDFDGVNNYLELANGSISLPCSTFVTQKLDSVINSAYTFGIQQSGNNGGYVLRTNGYQVIDAASPFPSITLSGASDTDEHLIYVSAINGGKISGAVDGGTLEQSTDDITGWTSAAYATTIGRRPDQASLHLNGKLKELIHFNTDQSANRTGIEAEIMDTYSIS